MLNTYNRFRAQPPTLQALGQRLIGNRRGVQQKVPVKAPPVQKFFNDALAARGMPLAQPAPYALATSTTRGLAGFGQFGSLGAFGMLGDSSAPIFPGGPSFAEEWSLKDYLSGPSAPSAWYNQLRQYADQPEKWDGPPSAAIADQAGKNWVRYDSTPDGARLKADFETELNAAIRQVDSLVSGVKIGVNVRDPAREGPRVRGMKAIKALVLEIASTPPPQPTPRTRTNTTPGSNVIYSERQDPITTGGGTSGGRGDGTGGGRGGGITQAPPPTAPEEKSNTALYVGGGIAVLAVGAAAYFLLKK